MTVWIGGNHYLVPRWPFIKAAPSAAELKREWGKAKGEICWQGDCPAEGTVLVTVDDHDSDVWMCFVHGREALGL